MFSKIKLLGVLLAIIFFAVSGRADAAPNWNTNTIQVTGMGKGSIIVGRSITVSASEPLPPNIGISIVTE